MPSIRCFIGLPLPQDWQGALDRVARRLAATLSSRISWTKPGNWHLTLKFLGDVDETRVPALVAALAGVGFAPIALRLGQAGSFPPAGRGGPKSLWAGLAEGAQDCERLAAQVDLVLAGFGFAPERRPFAAHVTLGRVKDAAAGDGWGAVAAALGREDFGLARMDRLVLWRSILGPQGPKYAALGEFLARQPATTAGVRSLEETT